MWLNRLRCCDPLKLAEPLPVVGSESCFMVASWNCKGFLFSALKQTLASLIWVYSYGRQGIRTQSHRIQILKATTTAKVKKYNSCCVKESGHSVVCAMQKNEQKKFFKRSKLRFDFQECDCDASLQHQMSRFRMIAKKIAKLRMTPISASEWHQRSHGSTFPASRSLSFILIAALNVLSP